MDFYAPEKQVGDRAKYKFKAAWVTEGLTVSSKKCLRMYKQVVSKPRDSPEFLAYKKYRNLYNTLRRKAKHVYYNDIIQRNMTDAKKLWKTLHKITGNLKNKQEVSNEININGVKVDDENIISNAFAKYYSELGKSLSDKITRTGNIQDPMLNMRNKVEQNCFLFPTTTPEIEKFIKRLKIKDSKGHDEISNRILKKIYPGIMQALEILFNKSLQEGTFPDNMKLAVVKPLYKNKAKTEIVNYRPISLLPVISKILEKIVHVRFVKFFTKHKVLYEGQYGFREKRSTTDAILDFTGNVIDNINKGCYTLALFLDMSKAFDSIKHDTLLRKLEFYGIRGNALSWISSYLSNRYIKVKYKNSLSDRYLVTYGTPQGSVLRPLMYLVLANDLVNCLKFSNCVTFADDTTIFAAGCNLKFLYSKINQDLKRLSEWFQCNSLTLNVEKSRYILFRSKRKEVDYTGHIELSGKEIAKVQNIKFLGVIIDEYLEWSLQAKSILTKMIAGNYSLSMMRNILPIHAKILLYHSNVASHLNYATSVWGPMLKEQDKKKIQIQQNKSVRHIFRINKRTRLAEYYKRGNILKFDDLSDLALLKISYCYISEILPPRITNMFNVVEHPYQTRNRGNLRAVQHTTQLYNKSFLGRAPGLWLNLMNELKNKSTIRAFVKACKKVKITTY